MSGDPVGFCPACGGPAAGNFCPACGTRLGVESACGGCGAALAPGAMYCAECGKAVGARPSKPANAFMPWILAAAALALFSFVIAILVQRGSVPRTGDMTATGGIPTPREASGGSTADAGMPSLEELSSMTPRQAADRLFERAMREHEGGDYERASFFLDMGLQAYAAVPSDDLDADARFHMGLMQLLMGDSTAARLSAADIGDAEPDNLLGLILSARVADFAGDETAASDYRRRLREEVEEEGGIPDRPDYESHRALIERELEVGT